MTTELHPIVSTAKDSQGFSLTIYNQNFAVVREQRQITLNQGTNFVRYEDVAIEIEPTSISFKSRTSPDAVVVREQNYQYDLLNPMSILKKSIGKTIRFRRVNPDGQIELLEGTLLNPPSMVSHEVQGMVIRLQDGRIVLNPGGEMELDEIPEGLVSRPSLLWNLDVSEAGTHATEVSYLANRITWKADYVAVVNQEETKVDITGWVTLDNSSGSTYQDAQLQLIAGDVRRVQSPRRSDYARVIFGEAAPPQFQEEAFFEYHLYTLQGTTTVRDNETKQITLMSAADVGMQRKLVYDSRHVWGDSEDDIRKAYANRHKVNIVLELQNNQENNMGMPLPKGKIRVYKVDERGNLQFLGEDLLDHTSRNETARFYIGSSFDVIGDRQCINSKKVSDNITEEDFEISIRNRKSNSIEILVVERFSGDWEILQSSHTHNKLDAHTVKFLITVEADSEVKITYRVRIIR